MDIIFKYNFRDFFPNQIDLPLHLTFIVETLVNKTLNITGEIIFGEEVTESIGTGNYLFK